MVVLSESVFLPRRASGPRTQQSANGDQGLFVESELDVRGMLTPLGIRSFYRRRRGSKEQKSWRVPIEKVVCHLVSIPITIT